jgi:C4-dicarboxylate-specific signal transduction histidine kinase
LKYLFRPFGELRDKQNMHDVVDYGIGIGLSCSFEIAQKMGGLVSLLETR